MKLASIFMQAVKTHPYHRRDTDMLFVFFFKAYFSGEKEITDILEFDNTNY